MKPTTINANIHIRCEATELTAALLYHNSQYKNHEVAGKVDKIKRMDDICMYMSTEKRLCLSEMFLFFHTCNLTHLR